MQDDTASYVFQQMTWEEIAAAADAGTPIAIPIGATEQHGRHLPVCTDWVLPQRILREAGRRRDLIVGPFLPFGYRSRPGSCGSQHFPGTVSLRATTFMSVIEDVLSELKRCGFRNILLYNWHYENSNFIYEPAYLVSEHNHELKIVVIEISLWMHHEPSAVRTDRIAADPPERVVNHDVVPIDTRMSTASGSLSSPVPATAEKGRLLTERLVDRLIAVLDEEFPRDGNSARGSDPDRR